MAPRRERLLFRFFNLVEGEAEGRFAIGAVVFAVLVVLLAGLWIYSSPRDCFRFVDCSSTRTADSLLLVLLRSGARLLPLRPHVPSAMACSCPKPKPIWSVRITAQCSYALSRQLSSYADGSLHAV